MYQLGRLRQAGVIANCARTQYPASVNPAKIEQEALALSDVERASLAIKLLDTLSLGTEVSDEEVERREREMDCGEVTPILREEFIRSVQQGRGR
jgi:hypothetical protein